MFAAPATAAPKVLGVFLAAGLIAFAARVGADDGEVARVKNMRFVYSATEPNAGQYQVYITGKQMDQDHSCGLFIAHTRMADGREQSSGGLLVGTASFSLQPTDFPVLLWLTDVRVESWETWNKSSAAQGRQTYGNPCQEAKSGITTGPVRVKLPANPNMPCDSVAVQIAGVRAAQHVSVGFDEVRVEISEPNSTAVYVAKLAAIDRASFQIEAAGGLYALTFRTAGASIQSFDNKGNRFDGSTEQLTLVCQTRADAETIRDRFLKR